MSDATMEATTTMASTSTVSRTVRLMESLEEPSTTGQRTPRAIRSGPYTRQLYDLVRGWDQIYYLDKASCDADQKLNKRGSGVICNDDDQCLSGWCAFGDNCPDWGICSPMSSQNLQNAKEHGDDKAMSCPLYHGEHGWVMPNDARSNVWGDTWCNCNDPIFTRVSNGPTGDCMFPGTDGPCGQSNDTGEAVGPHGGAPLKGAGLNPKDRVSKGGKDLPAARPLPGPPSPGA